MWILYLILGDYIVEYDIMMGIMLTQVTRVTSMGYQNGKDPL